MTERKITDEEVIKALECCASAECGKCKWEPRGDCYRGSMECNDDLMREALDLIKRQRAEIERLHSEVKEKTETIVFLKDQATGWSIDFCNLKAKLNTAKAEAIKEFADKLKEELTTGAAVMRVSVLNIIDDLVKELTEVKEQ